MVKEVRRKWTVRSSLNSKRGETKPPIQTPNPLTQRARIGTALREKLKIHLQRTMKRKPATSFGARMAKPESPLLCKEEPGVNVRSANGIL
jgi:hypothetical protein